MLLVTPTVQIVASTAGNSCYVAWREGGAYRDSMREEKLWLTPLFKSLKRLIL